MPVASSATLLLVLDLAGTFVFALGGALTALRIARLDIVGVVTLGLVTALGGGIIRDLLIGAVPPATFSDWRYLAVATAGGFVAFVVGRRLERFTLPIDLLDAAGLSLFAVTGASKALTSGSAITVAASRTDLYGVTAAVVAAAACFLVRSLGILFDLDAPKPPHGPPDHRAT
jgi:uncharacterized membrane protein YeiH